MKKKVLIIILIVVVVLVALFAFAYIRVMNPFNVGIDPLTRQNEQAETGKRLEITFSYSKQRLVASSQYAFWIEDMDGNYIDTIYVTQWTAQGGLSLHL